MSGTDTTPRIDTGAASAFRIAFGLLGLLTAIVGILLLVWPGKTAVVVTAILAVYVVIAGIVYIAIGLFSSSRGGWSRIGHIVLGALFIISGVIAFANLGATTLTLAFIVTIFIGISWIAEGIVALLTLKQSPSKGWTVFSAIISIVAGGFVLSTPLWAAVTLWWFLGISLVILGIVQIFRSFSFGKSVKVA